MIPTQLQIQFEKNNADKRIQICPTGEHSTKRERRSTKDELLHTEHGEDEELTWKQFQTR